MKINHSKEFYEKWISNAYLTKSDMVHYIKKAFGDTVRVVEVIDYLVYNNLSAWELKCITSVN